MATVKKQKPGKVTRVDTVTWKFIEGHKKPKERTATAIRRLLGLPPRKSEYEKPPVFYILPEAHVVCSSIEEARGVALVRWVRRGKIGPKERPIEVRAIA